MLRIKYITIVILFLFMMFGANSLTSADKNIKEGINTISSEQQNTSGSTNKYSTEEHLKQVLTISGNTVKYVGIITAVILPFILGLIGFQIFRSYQFEKEVRDTRKAMLEEYRKMVEIRNDSEGLIRDIKGKVKNLEEFVGSLAIDVLRQQASDMMDQMKEQTINAVIEREGEERKRYFELIKKYEALDLTLTPTVYIERGDLYLDQAQYEKAIENYNNAISLKDDDYRIYFKRSHVYNVIGKYEESIKDLEKTISIKPDLEAAYANMGVNYLAINKFEKAIECLTKSIKQNPKNAFSYAQRGIVHYKMNHHDLAIQDINQAEKLNPTDRITLGKIGHYYSLRGDFQKARSYYAKTIEKKKDIRSNLNLAECNVCLGNYDEAENRAREISSVCTDDRTKILSQYILVTALILGNKNYDEELASLEDYIRNHPEYKTKGWSFAELELCLKSITGKDDKVRLIENIVHLLTKQISYKEYLEKRKQ